MLSITNGTLHCQIYFNKPDWIGTCGCHETTYLHTIKLQFIICVQLSNYSDNFHVVLHVLKEFNWSMFSSQLLRCGAVRCGTVRYGLTMLRNWETKHEQCLVYLIHVAIVTLLWWNNSIRTFRNYIAVFRYLNIWFITVV